MNPSRWNFFPERFLQSESRSEAYGKFDQMVREEIAKGTIRPVETIDLVLDVMSLCLSSFIVAPMGFASSECDHNERKDYLDRRKTDITELVINGLKRS